MYICIYNYIYIYNVLDFRQGDRLTTCSVRYIGAHGESWDLR